MRIAVLVTLVALAGCETEPTKLAPDRVNGYKSENPADWKTVSIDDGFTFAFDRANVIKTQNFRTVITRATFEPGFMKISPTAVVGDNLTKFNCSDATYSTLRSTVYDASDKMIDDEMIDEPFGKIRPLDPNEYVRARVCAM